MARRLTRIPNQAVISEGIRLRPAGTLGHPKQAPPQGDTIEGFFIPGKTDVYVNWVAMQLRKDVFGDDAHIFRPERFLECSEKKKAEMERTVEMAFGAGRYQCSGKLIALTEIYKVVFEVGCGVLRKLPAKDLLTMRPGCIAIPPLRFPNSQS